MRGPGAGRATAHLTAAELVVFPSQHPARENALGATELLTGVRIPTPAPGVVSTYLKGTDRDAWTHAAVSVAAVLHLEGVRIRTASVVLGGVAPIPWRLLDADLTTTIPALLGSAFGNTGERCLAGSVAVTIGEATQMLLEALCAQTRKLVVGPGDQAGVDMGPLIRAEHRDRVAHYVEQGVAEGATLLVDGQTHMPRQGFFLGPTILNDVTPAITVG
jgi:hypothetical protein